MKKKCNHNQGFSLLELLIAIAIIAIIIVALASFMGTTTRSYRRTSENIAVRQNSQKLYDMIGDKLMQANDVRIGWKDGTNGAEYACFGTNASVGLDKAGHLLNADEALLTNTVLGNTLYSFTQLTAASTDITAVDTADEAGAGYVYITICYEQAIGTGYGAVIDTYYFYHGNVYLHRVKDSMRPNSIEENAGDVTQARRIQDSDIINIAASSDTDLEDMLVCEDVGDMNVYTIPDDNAVYLSITCKKVTRSATVDGTIAVRNSHVLVPAKLPAAIETVTE